MKRMRAKQTISIPVALALLFCAQVARSQSPEQSKSPVSELERKNLSLVGATASQIKQVLLSNPGLMVEVERWIAKNASDRGQIVTETDLSDGAIFDRLENDVEFRAAATSILQRYGYLMPELEAGSPLAKEQDLLIQERVQWFAQEEQQQRLREVQELQSAENCAIAARISSDNCAGVTERSTAPATLAAPLLTRPLNPGDETSPPIVPAAPALRQLANAPAIERAGLNRLDGTAGNTSSAPMLMDSNSLLQSVLGGAGANLQSSTLLAALGTDQISDLLSGLSGNPIGASLADQGASTNFTPRSALDTVAPAHPFGSPVLPVIPRDRSSQSDSTPGTPAHPGITAVANPYKDVPSLYDMYLQASSRLSEPTRFGSDVFEQGSLDPQVIPTDMPAGPDYVVGSGDGLTIDLWGSVSQRLQRTVDREGRIALPDAAPLLVSGKSLSQIQSELQQTLRHVYRDESADVSLSRLKTIRIYEVGNVRHPGAYDISALSTPLSALFAAGGPTDQGSLRIVKHYRGTQLIEEVDLYNLLLNGVKSSLQPLESGDSILIPATGPQVTIEGMVRRPAIYELKDEKSLSSVLQLAGGLLPSAALTHIEVQRLIAHEKRTMLSLDIPAADGAAAIAQKLDNFAVQDGDSIHVFPIAPYNEDVVYLEGHVLRPGRYSYKPNMRISDLVASYKDLLPEPATGYAEIIRLNPPDSRPSVESFNIADALEDPSSSPRLKPMDTVHIFSRFDFEDPPSVSVTGDIRTPGTYSTSGQIHLIDAIHLAGGIAPDGASDDVQVFRYAADGTAKVFSVSLREALAGDPAANIVLESHDRLLIHKTPGAVDPAVVFVRGDVVNPGRYPLAKNMTVADLIRAGGGLKPSANTDTADLTRYSYGGAGSGKLNVQHADIAISGALAGDSAANVSLHNGDVLTIRELPGWSDLGASITLKGEINSPGTYGIRPGERLSSAIERAGGFASTAYAFGAILQRPQVRELETQQQEELIARVRDQEAQINLLPESDSRSKAAKEVALQQYQSTLDQLAANPPLGRVAIRISADVARWKNTAADIELRAGDIITVPKRPGYVMVTGQVFEPMAVSYHPSRSAKWYLSQSGGATTLANKRAIFVIRADGSIIGGKQSIFTGDSLDAPLQPGDTVVVPERAIGGGPNWQTLFTAAQVSTSVASTIFIALHY